MSDREDRAVSDSPPGTWAPARAVAHAITGPIHRILAIEATSGILLMVATAVALVLANTGLATSYESLWHTPIGVNVGGHGFEQSLHFLINEGLMTIFFLVVGLEIRREIFEGELSSLKQASLPLVAALGGMLVPAALYFAFNAGRVGAGGWAVAMATDIAFAVGVLTLLGSRLPSSLRVLLLALAVIDDIGAIIVIAVFFSAGIAVEGFAIAGAGIAGVLVLRAAAVRLPFIYIVPGIVVWAGLYTAGVHPTLAGVILGLLTPVRPWFGPSGFAHTTADHLANLETGDKADLLHRLDAIDEARREAVSPVEHLVHALHPWVAFGVMPLFAFANAGVAFGDAKLDGDALWIFVGIVVGLAVGKPLGIAGMALLSSKAGISTRPAEMRASGVALVGVVGGIGFTMSLFIAQLAFPDRALLDTAKLGILVGSAIAMVVGLGFGALVIRSTPRS